jgi:hypothetical protein
MWQDMVMYWAWRGKERPQKEQANPPTRKRLEYVKIHYPNCHPEQMAMSICCGVFDDDKYRELHREEIKWHEDNGAEITWPSNV